MKDPHLNFTLIQFLAIKERILGDNPGIDDQTLADTVEGLSELPDKVAEILRDGMRAKAMAAGLQFLMDDMAARLERLKDRAERCRAIACDVMVEAKIDKLQMPDFTASVREAPRHVVVIDEALIPGDFWKPQKPTLRKDYLREQLQAGTEIAGATLSNPGMTLTVRTR